jgi:hypothetical protein
MSGASPGPLDREKPDRMDDRHAPTNGAPDSEEARTVVETDDSDGVLTSAADVESAGRSCLVILAMVVVILVLLFAWVLFTTTR